MSDRSMERLVGLAQRIGGKLIVHNPLEDHDVVILDVDEYEKLVMGKEEKWEQEMALDEEIEEEPLFSPSFGHDSHPADWHSISDVINKKYSALGGASEDELDFLDDDVGEEIKIEDIAKVEKKDDEPISVPFRPVGDGIAWQEEPLASDEPVFYEEPV